MIRGLHHFGLTVRDVEASAAWYVDVLGFQRVGEFNSPDGARRKVFLRHKGLRARLGLTQHRESGQDLFDETRVGLDHLAFAVSDRAELDAWAERLGAAAVVHSSIAPANSIPGAAVLVFRDPDNIQLELFVDPSDTDIETNKALVRRLIEAINQQNLEALDEVADGAIAEAARAWIGPFRDSFPDFTMEVVDLVAEGDKVVAHFKCSGTHLGAWMEKPPTGRRFEGIDEIYVFRVGNGRLAGVTAVVEDNLTRMQQLGL
jgi:catechol 2,3-dioxygenase-like lactoylglutathione lyase family enzyme